MVEIHCADVYSKQNRVDLRGKSAGEVLRNIYTFSYLSHFLFLSSHHSCLLRRHGCPHGANTWNGGRALSISSTTSVRLRVDLVNTHLVDLFNTKWPMIQASQW